jgi:phage-related protein
VWQGTLPRSHFAASNVSGIFSALCRQFPDLVGCPVICERTLPR